MSEKRCKFQALGSAILVTTAPEMAVSATAVLLIPIVNQWLLLPQIAQIMMTCAFPDRETQPFASCAIR